MLTKRIIRVSLTRTFEPPLADEKYDGTEWWCVKWAATTRSPSKTQELRHSHYTEQAARRHVSNLLELRVDGLSVEDVYSECV